MVDLRIVAGPELITVSCVSDPSLTYAYCFKIPTFPTWYLGQRLIPGTGGVITFTPLGSAYGEYQFSVIGRLNGVIAPGGIPLPVKLIAGGVLGFKDIQIQKTNNILTITHLEYTLHALATLEYKIETFRDWQPSDGGSDPGSGPSIAVGAAITRNVLPNMGPNDTPTTVVVEYTDPELDVAYYYIVVTPIYRRHIGPPDVCPSTTFIASSFNPYYLNTYSPSVSVTPKQVSVSWGPVLGYNINSAVLEVYQADTVGGLNRKKIYDESILKTGVINAGAQTLTFDTSNKYYSARIRGADVLEVTQESQPVTSQVQAIFPLDFTFIPGDRLIQCLYTPPPGKTPTRFRVNFKAESSSGWVNHIVRDINGIESPLGGFVSVPYGVIQAIGQVVMTDDTIYISSQTKTVVSSPPLPPTALTVIPVSYNASPTSDVNLQFTLPPYVGTTNVTVQYGFSNVVSSGGRPLTGGTAPANSYQMVDYSNTFVFAGSSGTNTITLSGMRTGNFTTSATNLVAGNSFDTPTNGLTISFTPTYQVNVINGSSDPVTSLIECVDQDSYDAYVADVNSSVPVVQARALSTADMTILTTTHENKPPGSLFEYQVSQDASSWYTFVNKTAETYTTLTTPPVGSASITLSGTRLPLPLYYRYRVFIGDSPIPIATSLPSTNLIKRIVYPLPLVDPSYSLTFSVTPSADITTHVNVEWTNDTSIPLDPDMGSNLLYSSNGSLTVLPSSTNNISLSVEVSSSTRIQITPRHSYTSILGNTLRYSRIPYDVTVVPELTQRLGSDNTSIVISGPPILNASAQLLVESAPENSGLMPVTTYIVNYSSNVSIPSTYLNNKVTARIKLGEAISSYSALFNLPIEYPLFAPVPANVSEKEYFGCQEISNKLAFTFKGRANHRVRAYYARVPTIAVSIETFVPTATSYELAFTSGINETRDEGNEYVTEIAPTEPGEPGNRSLEMFEIILVYVSSLGLESSKFFSFGFL